MSERTPLSPCRARFSTGFRRRPPRSSFLQAMISQPLACPHVPTPRSHPRCLDPPSEFPNYRAHLQPLPNDTQISSLENDQSLSEDLFPNSPEENVRIATSSIFSSTDGNTWFYIYFMYIKRMFPSIGRQYTRVAARTQTYPRYPPTCPRHPPTL